MGIDVTEINPQKYSQLILDKGAEEIQWRQDSPLNTWYGTTGYPYAIMIAITLLIWPLTLHPSPRMI